METYWIEGTPVGLMTAICRDEGLAALGFGELPRGERVESPLARHAFDQLREYFAGERQIFDLPLAPEGTSFQRAVWAALESIPYGQTRTYAQIAEQVGNPRACRAVGMANHRNPLAIVIPCHRVVGKSGTLTGYAGGLDVKARLLELERKANK